MRERPSLLWCRPFPLKSVFGLATLILIITMNPLEHPTPLERLQSVVREKDERCWACSSSRAMTAGRSSVLLLLLQCRFHTRRSKIEVIQASFFCIQSFQHRM